MAQGCPWSPGQQRARPIGPGRHRRICEDRSRSGEVPALPCPTVPALSTRQKGAIAMSQACRRRVAGVSQACRRRVTTVSLACHWPRVRVLRRFPICQAGAGRPDSTPGRGHLIVGLVGLCDRRVTTVTRRSLTCHGRVNGMSREVRPVGQMDSPSVRRVPEAGIPGLSGGT